MVFFAYGSSAVSKKDKQGKQTSTVSKKDASLPICQGSKIAPLKAPVKVPLKATRDFFVLGVRGGRGFWCEVDQLMGTRYGAG